MSGGSLGSGRNLKGYNAYGGGWRVGGLHGGGQRRWWLCAYGAVYREDLGCCTRFVGDGASVMILRLDGGGGLVLVYAY